MRLLTILLCLQTLLLADEPPQMLWSNNYTFMGNQTWSVGLVALDDGSFVISGPTLSSPGDMDAYLIAVNSDGTEIWQNSVSGLEGHSEMVSELIQTSSGGFLQAGFDLFNGDGTALCIWTDSNGDSLLYRTYTEGSFISRIAEKADGSTLVSGRLELFGEWFGWLGEIDNSRGMVWSNDFGPPGAETSLSDFVVLANNEILSCGFSNESPYLVRTNSMGDTLWTRTYPDISGSFNSIEPDPAGGFIIAGYEYLNYPENCTAYLVHINDFGETDWDINYSDVVEWSANDVTVCLDQGFIVCGTKTSGEDSWGLVFRTDNVGSLLWESEYGDIDDTLHESIALPSGGYCISGMSRSLEPDAAWLVRLGTETGIENQGSEDMKSLLTVTSSNPSMGSLSFELDLPANDHVTVSLHDLAGRCVSKVTDEFLTKGVHSFTIPSASFPGGVYVLRANASGIGDSETIVIVN